MTPTVCREVDNRHKDGQFVTDLQTEIAALRQAYRKVLAEKRALEVLLRLREITA